MSTRKKNKHRQRALVWRPANPRPTALSARQRAAMRGMAAQVYQEALACGFGPADALAAVMAAGIGMHPAVDQQLWRLG